MPHDLTHASFFSGVGGLDLGLERAGWRTVSFSEIDPYASAVLAERWPGVPNLGDITSLAAGVASDESRGGAADGIRHRALRRSEPDDQSGSAGGIHYHRHTDIHGDRYGHRHGDSPEWDAHIIVAHARGSSGVRAPRNKDAEGSSPSPEHHSLRDIGAGQPSGRRTDAATDGEVQRAADGERANRPGGDWQSATLWSGGFPCQDLSVAGKRAGFGIQHDRAGLVERGTRNAPSRRGRDGADGASHLGRGVADGGTRSGLAFAFLDLVEQHRPPLILLENVPGLLSSHRGRDMAALLGRLAELGYGVGYRILDARHFGVPQRRRRVFIVAVTPGGRAGAERAAEILSVGSRCGRHPAAGVEAGQGAADGVGDGAAFTLRRDPGGTTGNGWNTNYLPGQAPDPGGVRAPDGLAGRLDDSEQFPTLRGFGHGWQGQHNSDLGKVAPITGTIGPDDPLLPLGLDSHRYRCCGNGVVSSVAEWVGLRLLAAIERAA